MTMAMLKSIHIQGFKSIRDARVDLGRVNVLIGANASGKSNLVAFFRMLRAVVDARLQMHVAKRGGPAALLRFGPKVTATLTGVVTAGTRNSVGCQYRFALEPSAGNGFVFVVDACIWPESLDNQLSERRVLPGRPKIGTELTFEGTIPNPARTAVVAPGE